MYAALDIFLLEFPPQLLLTAIDNYCELVSRSLFSSLLRLPLCSIEQAYYENGALALAAAPEFRAR